MCLHGGYIGPQVTIYCKPRQARKGAAVAIDSGAWQGWYSCRPFDTPFNIRRRHHSMTYQVLARKWRPKSFQQLVGQKPVVQALTNAMNQNYLHHAYLFTGTRGVGKTTLARILAKCLNCEKNISAEPCGQCGNCQEIDAGNFPDLFEVDAASRTKVEETRELLDNVPYAPIKGRFKIYLIDEVHMLSGHSFNALLKTLEEPPAHVKFLLATTDPQRLPVTVLSRCLQFHLAPLSEDLIAEHLQFVLKNENIPYETAALNLIGRAADGSVRDALSLLDQNIAYGNGHIRESDTKQMLGITEPEILFALLNALLHENGDALHEGFQKLSETGAQFDQTLNDLLSILHQIAVLQAIPTTKNQKISQTLKALADQLSPENVQLYYQIALTGQRDLPYAPSPRTGFEMTLLRMLAFTPTNISITLPTPKSTAPAAVTTTVSAKKNENSPAEKWHTLLAKLNLDGAAKALAQQCSLKEYTDQHIYFLLHPKNRPLMQAQYVKRINEALNTYLEKNITVQIDIDESNFETPSDIALQQKEQQQLAAEQAVYNNATIQQLMNTFGASIVKDSIKPE
jgi:DNA polymerase-3 subunit gamma/tau